MYLNDTEMAELQNTTETHATQSNPSILFLYAFTIKKNPKISLKLYSAYYCKYFFVNNHITALHCPC